MEILGLHHTNWIVLFIYIVFILVLGWWSKKKIHNQESFLLGDRQFGIPLMVMQAFGAGTHPGDVAGVMSKTVATGASGIWVSWMWMFGTPFYWLIAPVIRRLRCLTMADFFRDRYSRLASTIYIFVASLGMIIFIASAMLATTRTVQGMMGKATVNEVVQNNKTNSQYLHATVEPDNIKNLRDKEPITKKESDIWFLSILIITTTVFILYSFWGGLIAAVRIDFVQGLLIIALSFIAIPAALKLSGVNGLSGMREVLSSAPWQEYNYLSLFDTKSFNLWTVVLLSINAPLSMISQPHIISICGAGKTEWEGRVGFTYGNILKRICTIGWSLLGLAWLAHSLSVGNNVHVDSAFGDSVRTLLPPVLQGVMLVSILAAAMSSGAAVQLTVAGLISQNIYREFINPKASEQKLLSVTRITGVFVMLVAMLIAILMRKSIVKTILDFFNITSLLGVTIILGILWRRMNSTGMYVSAIISILAFVISRYVFDCSRLITISLPIIGGLAGGIIGSLLSSKPDSAKINKFFVRINTPIGQEQKLGLKLNEVMPEKKVLISKGGWFITKPNRQSWLGFLIALLFCVLCVAAFQSILH